MPGANQNRAGVSIEKRVFFRTDYVTDRFLKFSKKGPIKTKEDKVMKAIFVFLLVFVFDFSEGQGRGLWPYSPQLKKKAASALSHLKTVEKNQREITRSMEQVFEGVTGEIDKLNKRCLSEKKRLKANLTQQLRPLRNRQRVVAGRLKSARQQHSFTVREMEQDKNAKLAKHRSGIKKTAELKRLEVTHRRAGAAVTEMENEIARLKARHEQTIEKYLAANLTADEQKLKTQMFSIEEELKSAFAEIELKRKALEMAGRELADFHRARRDAS